MTKVIAFPVRQELLLTKQQLARHLNRSTRWIELRVREGMPVEEATDRYGRRRYRLGAVEEWLRHGRPRRKEDRLTVLEREVAELRVQVAGLTRAAPVVAEERR